jgi:NAD(P)-dependent dehydrogenase (short-subunit alcohol dehydrogenase family)
MRYVITGGSGYVGSRLVEFLSRSEDTEKIVICDIAPPRRYVPKTEFERMDVRDRDGVRAVLERVRPDALVHLAFILNPSHDGLRFGCFEVGSSRGHLRRSRARLADGRPQGRLRPLPR